MYSISRLTTGPACKIANHSLSVSSGHRVQDFDSEALGA
jgi:hypothetical protein